MLQGGYWLQYLGHAVVTSQICSRYSNQNRAVLWAIEDELKSMIAAAPHFYGCTVVPDQEFAGHGPTTCQLFYRLRYNVELHLLQCVASSQQLPTYINLLSAIEGELKSMHMSLVAGVSDGLNWGHRSQVELTTISNIPRALFQYMDFTQFIIQTQKLNRCRREIKFTVNQNSHLVPIVTVPVPFLGPRQ